MSKSSYYKNNLVKNVTMSNLNDKIIEKDQSKVELKIDPPLEDSDIPPIEPTPNPNILYSVTIKCPHLTKRKEPSFQSERLGLVHAMEKYNIIAESDNWGQLEDNSWICLDYTIK